MNFLTNILFILSAPALFVPVFSGYVLGLFMIILAVFSRRGDKSLTSPSNFKSFATFLSPISRGAVLFWLSLCFSAITVAATSESFDAKALVSTLGNFFVKYLLLWLVFQSFWWRAGHSAKNWRLFSFSYAICAVINAIYCLIQRNTGADWVHGFGHYLGQNRFAYGVYRVSGFMGHPLTFGYCQAIALVGSSYFYSRSSGGREKIAWLVSTICAFLVLLISGSRGPQMAAFVGLITLVPVQLWRRRWKEMIGVTAVGVAIGVQVGFFNRFVELFSHGSGGDMRSVHWAVHWQIFKDNFWFGIGPGTAKSAISAYYFALNADDNIKLAHNTFLQCAADFGVVGLVGMCIWLLSWAKVVSQSLDASRVLLALLVVTIFGGLMQNNLQDSGYVLGLTTWTMMIVSNEVSRRDKYKGTAKSSDNLSGEGGSTS